MKNRILFLGFGLGSNRKEAVNINFNNHVKHVISGNDKYYIFSLSANKSIFVHLLKLPQYTYQIASIIKSKKITHVHDLFVLPMISVLFLIPIKFRFGKIKLVKELHNNFGFSRSLSFETILRFFLSSRLSVYLLSKITNTIYSRSKYISKFWNIKFIPQYISINKLRRAVKNKNKPYNVCYLGHPLYKKGVYFFPDLISILNLNNKKLFNFNFAFSKIGNRDRIVKLIKDSTKNKNINISFSGEVNASDFFRKNNIFILPTIDEHSATSVPNTILESMEAGCVVIASKNNINASVIKNNYNGILVNNINSKKIIRSLNNLVSSQKVYEEMSVNSRKYIEVNHNLSYIRDCFAEIYAK